jgi:hypothetical protein
VKAGVRALGIAESYRGDRSTLAGAVVRASRVVDGFAFETCTVGGTDATAALIALYDRLHREDVRYVLVSGIAPAWFNLVDLTEVHAATGLPTLSVTYEASDGLDAALTEHFSGAALDERREIYERQPQRRQVAINDQEVYVRAVGLVDEDAADVVRAFTPEGGRPEPCRVARLAARGVDSLLDEGAN